MFVGKRERGQREVAGRGREGGKEGERDCCRQGEWKERSGKEGQIRERRQTEGHRTYTRGERQSEQRNRERGLRKEEGKNRQEDKEREGERKDESWEVQNGRESERSTKRVRRGEESREENTEREEENEDIRGTGKRWTIQKLEMGGENKIGG